jgi:hypothetical protein
MLIFTINDQLEENEIIIMIFDHHTQTRKPMELVFRSERLQDHHRQRQLSLQNNIIFITFDCSGNSSC